MMSYLDNNVWRLSAPPKHRGPDSILMKFGAHVSIRGALHLAVDRAVAIGCECLQIFVGSPRQWREVIFSERDLDLFLEKSRTARLHPPVAHTPRLCKLGAAALGLYP